MSLIPPIPDFINQEEHSYENISQDLGIGPIGIFLVLVQNILMSQRLLIILKPIIIVKLFKEFMLLIKNMKTVVF